MAVQPPAAALLPAQEAVGDALDIDAIGLLADEYYRTLHGPPKRGENTDDDSEEGAL